MPETDIYDPERALWKPGRRSFLFMFGAAVASAMLPSPQEYLAPAGLMDAAGWQSVNLQVNDTFTIEGVYAANPIPYVHTVSFEVFRVTGIQGSVIMLDRPIPSNGRLVYA